MQLVLSNNRVLAHGENFIAMGGVVINTETGAKYENATVAECDGCPSDIDKVGYEYHAGVFVPCAPYGESCDGDILVACECGTPKKSKFNINTLNNVIGSRRNALFTTSGSWTAPADVTYAKIVCVGGGGGGGGGCIDVMAGGGGGGSGHIQIKDMKLIPGKTYTIVIGAGGAGGANDGSNGEKGGTTYFDDFYAEGGMGGGGASKINGEKIGGNGGDGEAGGGGGAGGQKGGNGGNGRYYGGGGRPGNGGDSNGELGNGGVKYGYPGGELSGKSFEDSLYLLSPFVIPKSVLSVVGNGYGGTSGYASDFGTSGTYAGAGGGGYCCSGRASVKAGALYASRGGGGGGFFDGYGSGGDGGGGASSSSGTELPGSAGEAGVCLILY